jgi:hypothetical protein
MSDFGPILPHDLGICAAFEPLSKYYTLMVSTYVAVMIYVAAMVLGLRNIYKLLIKQNYYKSVFVTGQYIFGQAVCVTRIM